MIVHKCDNCDKEIFDADFKLHIKYGRDLEFCNSECVINYLKKRDEDIKKLRKELTNNDNKRVLVGVGCMLVGAALVVIGLFQIPVVPVVLILMGVALGFSGYKIYEQRGKDKPDGMVYGRKS